MDYRAVVIRTACTGALLTAALLTAGCAQHRYLVDESFGEAMRAAKAQQTLNPDASRNMTPPPGLDGVAAKTTIDRYQRSSEAPPTAAIGVGGGATGGAQPAR